MAHSGIYCGIPGAADVLLPLFPNPLPIPVRVVLTVVLSLVVLPLLLAQSLASKRMIYATGLSLVTYVAWLGCVTYAYTKGTLRATSGFFQLGIFWEAISVFFPPIIQILGSLPCLE